MSATGEVVMENILWLKQRTGTSKIEKGLYVSR